MCASVSEGVFDLHDLYVYFESTFRSIAFCLLVGVCFGGEYYFFFWWSFFIRLLTQINQFYNDFHAKDTYRVKYCLKLLLSLLLLSIVV